MDARPASRSCAARGARDGYGLGAILIVAAVIRMVAWSRTAVLFNDGPVFLAMAEAVGQGRFAEVLAHPYHPLYPCLVALSALLPISLEAAAVSVSIAGGLLSIAALFYFVRDAFGRDIAWLAAGVVALHPWHVDFTSDVMSDGLYAGFFMLAFAALARLVIRPSVGNVSLCGLSIGLAYLVRPEGVGLALVAGLLMALRGFRDPASRARFTGFALALLLVVGLVIVPFVLAVGEQTGEWALTQKKSVSGLVGVESSDASRKPAAHLAELSLPLPELAIRADGRGARIPDRDLRGVMDALLRVAATSLSVFRVELVPFLLVGAWALARRGARPVLGWTLLLPIALYGGVLVLLVWSEGYVSRRHALWPWLPAIGLAALGWQQVVARYAPSRMRGPRAVAIGLACVLALGWGPRDLRARRLDRAPVRVAAEWVAAEHPSSGAVAAQKLRTAYYAGADFVPLMPGLDGRLEAYLRGRAARWVIIDADKLEDHHGLEAGIGDWLEPIHSVSDQGRRILVLALKDREPAS